MAISKNKTDKKQLSLFEIIKSQNAPIAKGSLKIQPQFEEILSDCINKAPFSRLQIVLNMSDLLHTEISIHMLNAWTAISKEKHRFPAVYLPAFCKAVCSYEPLVFLSEASGMFLLPGPEALRSEIQKLEEKIENLQEEKEKRLSFLKEITGKHGNEQE